MWKVESFEDDAITKNLESRTKMQESRLKITENR